MGLLQWYSVAGGRRGGVCAHNPAYPGLQPVPHPGPPALQYADHQVSQLLKRFFEETNPKDLYMRRIQAIM